MSTDVSRSPSAEPQTAPNVLNLVVSRGLGTVVVTVHGELDDGSCELLKIMLADLIEGQGAQAVAVDLAQATAGPATATALTVAACRARQLATRFVVKGPSRQIIEELASREWGELIDILPQGDPP